MNQTKNGWLFVALLVLVFLASSLPSAAFWGSKKPSGIYRDSALKVSFYNFRKDGAVIWGTKLPGKPELGVEMDWKIRKNEGDLKEMVRKAVPQAANVSNFIVVQRKDKSIEAAFYFSGDDLINLFTGVRFIPDQER